MAPQFIPADFKCQSRNLGYGIFLLLWQYVKLAIKRCSWRIVAMKTQGESHTDSRLLGLSIISRYSLQGAMIAM
jgi:hypothetical protein